MMRKSGLDLTPDLYLVKLLLGSVDSSYDECVISSSAVVVVRSNVLECNPSSPASAGKTSRFFQAPPFTSCIGYFPYSLF